MGLRNHSARTHSSPIRDAFVVDDMIWCCQSNAKVTKLSMRTISYSKHHKYSFFDATPPIRRLEGCSDRSAWGRRSLGQGAAPASSAFKINCASRASNSPTEEALPTPTIVLTAREVRSHHSCYSPWASCDTGFSRLFSTDFNFRDDVWRQTSSFGCIWVIQPTRRQTTKIG